MPQINMFFNERVNKIVEKFQDRFKLSKPETVLKIIEDFNNIDGHS